MTPVDLKENFDRAYAGTHQSMPDIDAYIAGETDIPEVEYEIPLGTYDLPEDAALKMLEARVYYWEHYGWLKSAMTAVYFVASAHDYDLAQGYAQWLIDQLPKGHQEVDGVKDLQEWSNGVFPKEKFRRRDAMIDMLKNRTFEPAPAWKVRKPVASAGV